MGSDIWNNSKKKLRNIKGTKVMFWYKWLEKSSPVPGKGVGLGGVEKQTNHFLRRVPFLTLVLRPWGDYLVTIFLYNFSSWIPEDLHAKFELPT